MGQNGGFRALDPLSSLLYEEFAAGAAGFLYSFAPSGLLVCMGGLLLFLLLFAEFEGGWLTL